MIYPFHFWTGRVGNLGIVGAFRSRKNLDLSRARVVGDLSTFLGDAEAKKVPAGQGRADKWMGFKRRKLGRERFSSGRGKWVEVLRALSNCIPERQRAKGEEEGIGRDKHCRRPWKFLSMTFINVRTRLFDVVERWERRGRGHGGRGCARSGVVEKDKVRRVVAFLAAHSPGETIRKTRGK